MGERGTIGQILMSVGRISESDVATALAYQQRHGGYFGEALMSCGLVSEGELEWGLASQFDLPFVFPDADSIDYEAASMVAPEWALTHLTLPILRTAKALTVIVESPIKTKAVEDLRALTDLDIELALAAPSKIRELIRQVYARGAAAEEGEARAPVELAEVLDEVIQVAAPRFGVSVRGRRSWAWWDDAGAIRRRPLAGDWAATLEHVVEPSPGQTTGERTRCDWSGRLAHSGIVVPVEVHVLADESGREYLFDAHHEDSELEGRFSRPSAGVLAEVRLLARSGKARFIVVAEPPELGHEILPHLPTLLLDPSWRGLYITSREGPAADEAFSLQLSQDPTTWATELEALRAFHFDVVTVDLTGGEDDWPASALDVASVAFLLWASQRDVAPAYEAGIRWQLHISRGDGGQLEWSLEPLRQGAGAAAPVR